MSEDKKIIITDDKDLMRDIIFGGVDEHAIEILKAIGKYKLNREEAIKVIGRFLDISSYLGKPLNERRSEERIDNAVLDMTKAAKDQKDGYNLRSLVIAKVTSFIASHDMTREERGTFYRAVFGRELG